LFLSVLLFELQVLNAIFIMVCVNNLMMNLVSLPMFENLTYFIFTLFICWGVPCLCVIR
jgi:hypothetical protein